MYYPTRSIVFSLVIFGLFAAPMQAEAQLGRIAERAKQKAEEKIAEKTGNTPDNPQSGNTTAAQPQAANPTPSGGAAAAQKPGEGAWVNYDFVPGERILFADDFGRDNVGDFPRRLELINGNMEVAEYQGKRYLRNGSGNVASFVIQLPETLPERFTVEFDARLATGNGGTITFDDPNLYYGRDAEKQIDRIMFVTHSFVVEGRGRQSSGRPGEELAGKVFPFRIMVDGSYVKVYAGGTRVANVPNAKLGRSNKIHITLPSHDDVGVLIGDIRIAAGGKKLYDAIAAEGRVATQGILFDTGSDRIRPESTPTLKEITSMLKERGDLKLMIEGHTDNVGQKATNQTLSEQRAAAVKAYLVSQGIDASRLQSQGLGDSKPATGNDTPEGRQQNRRVELVRL